MIKSAKPIAVLAACFLSLGAHKASAQPRAWTPPPLKLEPCRVPDVSETLRCGTYRVPEDRTRPSERVLPLKVVVIPARRGSSKRDAILYFEGGPGQAATDSASYVADLFIRDERDVILVDQRGTGEGHRLTCDLPGSDLVVQGYLDKPIDGYKACATKLSKRADLTQYVTPVAMRDMDEIRSALGYEKVTVYGGSYASRAAMIYARNYPQHVSSIYIGAAVPLALRMPLYFAWSSQRALDRRLARCAQDSTCNAKFPDPMRDLAEARARLLRQPARVTIKHPTTQKPVEVVLTEWGLVTALVGRMYASDDVSSVPALFRQVRQGDYVDLIEKWIARTRATRSSVALGMNRAIVCNEDVARIGPDEAKREARHTFIGPAMVEEAREICSAFPKAQLPGDYFDAFKNDLPTLILSGEFDPVTPPRWGEEARRSFPNSIHMVANEGHHFDASKGCLNKVATQFLADVPISRIDTGCASDPVGGVRRLP